MGVLKRTIKRKDGQKSTYWYIRYRLNGKDKWESVGKVGEVTKAVAQIRLEEKKRRIRRGELDMVDAEIPLLREFGEEYIKHVRDIKKKRSWKKDEVTLRHLVGFFGEKRLSDITPRDIDDYKEHMLNEGYKPGSVNRELSCLKYLYNLAIRWRKYFGINPVTEVEFLDEGEWIISILTFEEEVRLLSESSDYLQKIITIALNTAMRKMEILSLEWAYVDLEKRIITLPQTNTKAKKTRLIPISSVLHKILIEQKLKCDGSDFVFPSKDSNTGHINWLKRSFSTACKRAGIEGLRFHDLRHTAATRMIEAGVDVVTVSKLLGHSDINLTVKRYLHPEESLKDAVEKLANYNNSCSNNCSNAVLD